MVVILYPLFILLFMNIFFHKLGEDYYKNSVGSIYDKIRLNSKSPILYQVVFLLRRILFGGIALVASSSPIL